MHLGMQICARILQSKKCLKRKIERKQKAWKECEKKRKNEKHEKKRIGKQNKKRTKKVGTNSLEKKRELNELLKLKMRVAYTCISELGHL